MAEALGLVGGAGALPALMAREARRAGWRVVAFALADAPSPSFLMPIAWCPCRLGDVGPILAALGEEGIRHVVLSGRVRKDVLFQGAPLDAAARQLRVARRADWTDDGLLGAAVQALAAMGIEVLDQRQFLAPWLVRPRLVAGPPVRPELEADVARGASTWPATWRSAGVGQTVVLRSRRRSRPSRRWREPTRPSAGASPWRAGRGRGQGAGARARLPASTCPPSAPRRSTAARRAGRPCWRSRRGACCCSSASASQAEAARPGMSVVGVAERPGVD